MRVVTRTYEVYPLAALAPNAQQAAHSQWVATFDYQWSEDNRQTLEAFCTLLKVVCTQWEYNAHTYNFSCSTTHRETVEELSGQRLATYLTNSYWSSLYPPKCQGKNSKSRKSRIFTDSYCPLTGYHVDEELLQPIYDFLSKPEASITFLTLINACLDRFFAACRDDMGYSQSEECFREVSELNEWEYLSTGQQFY